LFKIF